MLIIEFLKKHDIRWIPIHLEIEITSRGKIKKNLKPYENGKMPSYNDLSNLDLVNERQKLISKYEYIWIDTNFVNQIDIDGDIDPKLESPYFNSVTKNKPHYFVSGFLGFNKKRCNTKWKDVELLCGQGSYAKKDYMVCNANMSIKDYSGNINEVLIETSSTDSNKKTLKCLNSNINIILNEMFYTTGNWKSNSYSNSRTIVLIPEKDKTCLVNKDKTHSCVQCYVTIGKATCNAKCYSCGEKSIDIKKNSSNWKQIKGYFDFTSNDENITYDQIQDYVDDYCKENDLMKKDGYMMKRSKECKVEYEKIARFSDWLDDLFRLAELNLKSAYKKPLAKKHLEEYLNNIHTDIRILKRNNNIVSFKNGFLKLKEFTFHPYNESEKYTFIAKKYIPLDFDADWLQMEWDQIQIPIFDKIIKDQPQIYENKDVLQVFYGLLGSLHYPVGMDSIKVTPYLVGTSGTGKSTIMNIFMQTFSSECIGAINYKERTFGKSAFLDHDVIMDTDTPANMITLFGKTDFQKAVSGETIAIPIKNQKQEEQHKVTQRMFFCSQYMQDCQDTGEVIRRIAYFGFEPVQNTTSNLEENCIKTELNLVLIKALLARRKILQKYGSTPFHEWKINYFDSRKDDILWENNQIYRMISEHKYFKIRKGCEFPFEEFIEMFHEFYKGQPNRPKKPKNTDVMFTKMGLKVQKKVFCKECMKPFCFDVKCCSNHAPNNRKTKYFISDLYYDDSIDSRNILDDDIDIL